MVPTQAVFRGKSRRDFSPIEQGQAKMRKRKDFREIFIHKVVKTLFFARLHIGRKKFILIPKSLLLRVVKTPISFLYKWENFFFRVNLENRIYRQQLQNCLRRAAVPMRGDAGLVRQSGKP